MREEEGSGEELRDRFVDVYFQQIYPVIPPQFILNSVRHKQQTLHILSHYSCTDGPVSWHIGQAVYVPSYKNSINHVMAGKITEKN